jgi:hypothetical protein
MRHFRPDHGKTILTPNDVQFLLRYFAGIDQALCRRYSLGFRPDEEHLTSLLCELLDSKGVELHNLPYGIAQLNEDLKQSGSLVRAEISVKTNAYNKHQERYLTQSDLGIIVEYEDRVEPALSFKNGVLVQAKRLFPLRNGEYGLDSKYESFDEDQHLRLEKLMKDFGVLAGGDPEFGSHCAKYLFYNPPLADLPIREREKIIHSQLRRETSSIFDYTAGLHVYQDLSQAEVNSTRLKSACLFMPLAGVHALALKAGQNKRTSAAGTATVAAFTLGDVVEAADIRFSSLPYFFVFELIMNNVGCSGDDFIKFITESASGRVRELQFTSPRYLLHIRLTAGSVEG